MPIRASLIVMCVGLLCGCDMSGPAPAPTPTPPDATPTASAGIAIFVPAETTPNEVTLVAIPTATLVPTRPTLTQTPKPTQRPTQVPATPTPSGPTPTPDPTRVSQQRYCDQAAPPAHIPLPPQTMSVRIPLPDTATQLPDAAPGGPRRDGGDAAPSVTARSVVVLDEASGNVLYAREPSIRRPPASITKIVTTIVALERAPDLKTVYKTTVSASALVPCDGSSVMGLEPDDHVTLETLLFGMMLPSGNDAAEQVAASVAGSRERYVALMNEKVQALHLVDTHFATPSGMDADDQYSSAYDMAILARYAMRNEEFRKLASTTYFVGDDYYMHNLNPLLGSYPGADGVKIGYTDIAGRTMVASATRDGHRVYVSLMASRNLAADATTLFDWVWRTFRW